MGTKPKPPATAGRIAAAILEFLSDIPTTKEPSNASPSERARRIANVAARKACLVSGSLAIPPGLAGLMTVVPDLIAVWKIQAQMIVDIAGAFGKSGALTREEMLYFLFRHSAAQAVRDLVVRVGERQIIRRSSVRVVQRVAARIGAKVTQSALVKSVSRWLPVVGVLGVAGYAFYDTAQVAETAISQFEKERDFRPKPRPSNRRVAVKRPKRAKRPHAATEIRADPETRVSPLISRRKAVRKSGSRRPGLRG